MSELAHIDAATIPATFEEMVDRVLALQREVMLNRHRKYGPNNIGRSGLHGVIVRGGDKLARIETAAAGQGTEAEETVEETLIDWANYGLIGVCINRGWWTRDHCPTMEEHI